MIARPLHLGAKGEARSDGCVGRPLRSRSDGEAVDRSRERLARMPASRSYDRAPADLRPVTIEPGFVRTADGSALISQGETRVICTASVSGTVPRWMEGKGRGWVTGRVRDAARLDRRPQGARHQQGRQDGRGVEIQRLIGRSLRGVVDFEALGERTRLRRLRRPAGRRGHPLRGDHRRLRGPAAGAAEAGRGRRARDACRSTGRSPRSASGSSTGEALCDLDYSEDSTAEVDANVVMTGDGGLVEVQATAERTPLSRASLDELLALAEAAIASLRASQEGAVGELRGLMPWPASRHCSWRPATSTSSASCARSSRARAATRFRPRSSCRPRRARPSPRTRSVKARAARAATGSAAIADDSGIEARRSAARPGCAPPATPARTRATRRTSPSCSTRSGRPGGPAGRLRLRARLRRRGRRRGAVRGPLRGDPGERAAWHRAASATTPPSSPTTPAQATSRTMAELEPAEKHAISHRGRAAGRWPRTCGAEVPAEPRARPMIRTKTGAAGGSRSPRTRC